MAKKTKRALKVNMKDVETSVLIPEGDYLVEVAEVEVAESESSGKEYLKWKFEVLEPESCKGQSLYHNTSLQPQALFNLKGVLISLGMNVPNNTLEIDLDDVEGRQMGVTVEHEIYEGKKKARVTETFPWDGEGDGEDDDSIDPSTLDLDELIEFAAEQGIDLSSLKAKDKKNKAKVLALVEAAMEESEDDESGDDETGEDDSEDDGLDDMDIKALKKYAKENDIDLSELSAKDAKNADKVRDAIRAASSDDGEEEDAEAIDFDGMDLKELLAFAKENDIAISKKIAKDVKKVRAHIIEEYSPEGDEVDLDSMDLDELLAFAAENDIAISKKIKADEKKVRAYIASELEEE